MTRIAERYRGRVDSWELWNEPDNRDYWLGTPAEYAHLLETGARGVRAGNPGATVVFGGLASRPEFLDEVLAAGVGRSVDVVDVHAYFETWNPTPLEQIPAAVQAFAGAIRRHGGHQSIWMAEVGYAAPPALQPAALVRTLAVVLGAPEVALVGWYRLRDPAADLPMIGDENNRRLGVAFADGRPKPAFAALRFVAALFARGYEPVPSEVHGVRASVPAFARAFRFADGRAVALAWLPTRAPAARVELEVTLPIETAGGGTRRTATGEPGPPLTVRHEPGRTTLSPLDVGPGEVAVVTLNEPAPSGVP
jgi:hypothetical protein